MRETLNRKDFFKSEVKRTLIKQQLRGNPVKVLLICRSGVFQAAERSSLHLQTAAPVVKDENVDVNQSTSAL